MMGACAVFYLYEYRVYSFFNLRRLLSKSSLDSTLDDRQLGEDIEFDNDEMPDIFKKRADNPNALTKIKYEIFNINDPKPEIFISQHCICFTKELVETLGYPEYVQYLLNEKEKVFAIRACNESDIHAVSFTNNTNRETGIFETNRHLVSILCKGIGTYLFRNRYRVWGCVESGSIYFDLAKAESYYSYDNFCKKLDNEKDDE